MSSDPKTIAVNRENAVPAETQSGIPLAPVYGPDDLDPGWSYPGSLGNPGQFPFTRGPHETMYRGKPWTMRMFSGFGTPEDTNRRFHYLLAHGQTGLSTAFDMPTLMGFDPDDALARGEVGREGVSVASVADVERLFADIPLDQVTTSIPSTRPRSSCWRSTSSRRSGVGSPPKRCAARSRTICS